MSNSFDGAGSNRFSSSLQDLADPSVERRIPEVMHEMYDFMRRFKAFRTEAGTMFALNKKMLPRAK